MLTFPNILPADPRAPEGVTYRRKLLSYGWFGRLLLAREIRRERKELRDLGPALLNDIGRTPDDIIREAKRPFWDAPQRWKSSQGSIERHYGDALRLFTQPVSH